MTENTNTANILDVILQAWGWTGLEPQKVLMQNLFGNLIVEAIDGHVWRICPEELSCDRIAESQEVFCVCRQHNLDTEVKTEGGVLALWMHVMRSFVHSTTAF